MKFKESINNVQNINNNNGAIPVVMASAKEEADKNDKKASAQVETDLQKLSKQKPFTSADKQPQPASTKVADKLTLDESLFDEAVTAAAVGTAVKIGAKWVIAHLPEIIAVLESLGVAAASIKDIVLHAQQPKETTKDVKEAVNSIDHGLTYKGKYYSDEDRSGGIDKKMKKDLWTIVYDELCPISINIMTTTKFPNVRLRDRYGATGRCYSDGEKITVYAKDKDGLKFAYDVANYYGVKISIPKEEHFKDPDKQVSCTLTIPVEGD